MKIWVKIGTTMETSIQCPGGKANQMLAGRKEIGYKIENTAMSSYAPMVQFMVNALYKSLNAVCWSHPLILKKGLKKEVIGQEKVQRRAKWRIRGLRWVLCRQARTL